jgi:hypothetical protein
VSATGQRYPGNFDLVCDVYWQAMSLSRAAWTTVAAICAIAALLLLINGYDGYSAVLLFVGLAAAVNLLP